jgi:hypothetical protein
MSMQRTQYTLVGMSIGDHHHRRAGQLELTNRSQRHVLLPQTITWPRQPRHDSSDRVSVSSLTGADSLR